MTLWELCVTILLPLWASVLIADHMDLEALATWALIGTVWLLCIMWGFHENDQRLDRERAERMRRRS